MDQTQGHHNEGMSSGQRFLTLVSAAKSDSNIFLTAHPPHPTLQKINISCLCYYRIPPSPSFLTSASSPAPLSQLEPVEFNKAPHYWGDTMALSGT